MSAASWRNGRIKSSSHNSAQDFHSYESNLTYIFMKATSNPESEAIRTRFFDAIEELKKMKRTNLTTFARDYGIDQSNLLKLKKAERKPIPGWYLAVLVRDYGISAEWLLLGTGQMLKS